MPYKLSGNKVVRSDTGQVVKDHGGDHAKAVRHLRALKANVEEGSPAVLGALLEGAFDEARHPRGFHGRWIRGRGGKPGRLEGTYNGVKLERGVAYQGELAGGKVFTGHWTGEVEGFGREGASAQEPIFRHVEDPTMRRTFSGGKFYGRLADVKPRSNHPAPTPGLPPDAQRLMRARARVAAPNEQRSDEMASGPLRRVSAADLGRSAPPAKITGPSVAVTTNDGRRISVDAARREQTDYHAAHGKPSPFLPSHVKPYTAKDDPAAIYRDELKRATGEIKPQMVGVGSLARPQITGAQRAAAKGRASRRTTDRLANVRGLEDAGRKAQAERAEILAKSPGAQRELDQHRAIARGAGQELAQTRQAISSLRPGGRYDLHGGEGKIGHVLHASGGRYEVHHGGQVQVHRTPSSAAGHAMKLQRAALSSLGARQRGRAGRLQASAPGPLDEIVNFGGIPTKKGDVIAQLQREGHPQIYIDRYLQGLERARKIRESTPAPAVLGALLEGAELSERFVSQDKRGALAKKGHALHVDGRDIFPIETAKDAENAKTLYLSGHHKTPAAKAHIVRNARRVGATGVVQALQGS